MNRLPSQPQPQYPTWCPKCPKCPPPKVCQPQVRTQLNCPPNSTLQLFQVKNVDWSGLVDLYWTVSEPNNSSFSIQISADMSFNPRNVIEEYPITPMITTQGTIKSDFVLTQTSILRVMRQYYARVVQRINGELSINSNIVPINFVYTDLLYRNEVLNQSYQRVDRNRFTFNFFMNIGLTTYLQRFSPRYNLEIVDLNGNVSLHDVNVRNGLSDPNSSIVNMKGDCLLSDRLFFDEEQVRRIKARVVVTIDNNVKLYSNYLNPSYGGEIYILQ